MRGVIRNPRAMIGLTIVLIFSFIAIFSPWLDPYNPFSQNYVFPTNPNWHHLLGVTTQGQDIFSQLLYGSRESLLVGVVTALVIVFVQFFFGIFAGYLGGWVDALASTITNVFLVLPALPLIIVIIAFVRTQSVLVTMVVLVITGWAWGARVLRSQAIALRDRPFVEAARMSGEPAWRIVTFNIVPNMFGIMAANFFGAVVFAIITEAGLDFLGLGNPNAVTWGNMIYLAQQNNAIQFGFASMWAWLAAPIACIAVVGTGFSLLNFAVDEIADPRLRRG